MNICVLSGLTKRVRGKLLLAACLALPLAGAGCTVRTYDRPYRERVYVDVAPPPIRREVVPVRPGPDYVWVDGYYAWRDGRHEWVGGHYVRPPRREARWEPGRWERDRGRYYYVEGRWR